MPRSYDNTRQYKRARANWVNIFLGLMYSLLVYLLTTPKRLITYFIPPPEKKEKSINELVDFINSSSKSEKHIQAKKPRAKKLKTPIELESEVEADTKSSQITVKEASNIELTKDKKIEQDTIKSKLSAKKETQKTRTPTKGKVRKHISLNQKYLFGKQGYSETTTNDDEDFLEETKKQSAIKFEKPDLLGRLPDELKYRIALFLDTKSKLTLRQVASVYRKIISIDASQPTSFFKPIDKNEFLYLLIKNNQELLSAYADLACFQSITSLPHNILQITQSSFKKLENKYHATNTNVVENAQERQLLRFYRELLDKERSIDLEKFKKAIVDFRHYLYKEGLLEYKVVFHVDRVGTLEDAVSTWEIKDNAAMVYFEVGPHDIFFYPIENLSSLAQGSILTMLVIPSHQFDDKNDYKSKTDFQRSYEVLAPNNAPSKLKQHIGNCRYSIDPSWPIVTLELVGANKQITYRINENRCLGLDIVITQDEKRSLEDVLPNYLDSLRSKDLKFKSEMK